MPELPHQKKKSLNFKEVKENHYEHLIVHHPSPYRISLEDPQDTNLSKTLQDVLEDQKHSQETL